jgi:hypothetical protein
MTMHEAIRLFNNYLQSNHKQRTIDKYRWSGFLGQETGIYKW